MDQSQLTPRQREVLAEVCKGHSNKEIARTLGLAEATVKLHLTEIFKALGVRTRYEAMVKCKRKPDAAPQIPLSNEDILAEFANTTFTTLNVTWAERVLTFGRNVLERKKAKEVAEE